MAISREALLLRRDPHAAVTRTPGTLGRRDAADPSSPPAFVGDTPGPLGIRDVAARRAGGATGNGTPAHLPSSRDPIPAWLTLLVEWTPAIGPLVDVLRALGSGATGPVWMERAADEVGVKEKAGKLKHNERIIQYHATTTLQAQNDETPWCSSFVNWVMKEAGYGGTGSALALSWKSWGDEIPKPALGSIGVIDWGKQDAKKKGKGHVGFVVGQTAKGSLVLLGGNQSDSVSRTAFGRQLFVSFRVPKGFAVKPELYDLPELKLEAGGFRETR